MTCACGFKGYSIWPPYSSVWQRAHKKHHLSVYPDVDDNTIRNLDDSIARAQKKEQQQ